MPKETRSDGVNRRQLLAAGAGGIGLYAGTGTATGLVFDDGPEFEEREWGQVRTDFTEPAGEDRPVILTVDGYEHDSPTHYLEMRDGTAIAVDVASEPDDRTWRAPPVSDEYVCVHASIRGSGCSSGTFDLYDRTHARDGYEIVEWLADRPWANGDVGLYGYSYSGFTGFFIAAEQPPSLVAVSANLLTADLYRDLVFPGGVPNTIFPLFWAGLRRPFGGTGMSAYDGIVEDGDTECLGNVLDRGVAHPFDLEPTWYTRRTDDNHWRNRSLISYADRIEVPIYISHAWQDEQTAGRGGPELFRAVDPEPASPPGTPPGRDPLHESPKLLRATNGVHSTAEDVCDEDAADWFDYWMRGDETGIMDEAPVKLHLNRGSDGHTTFGLDGYPDDDTDWTRYYLRDDGRLERSEPSEPDASDEFFAGAPRRNWFFEEPDAGQPLAYADGPDVLTYRTEPVTEPAVLAGPITATLYAESTAPTTRFFVDVGVERDGNLTPLSRGLLDASHRAIDEDRTLYNDDGEIVRPYRPHESPEPITPGEIYRYDVEVFPTGHLLHPGQRLVVSITTPPVLDGLAGFEPTNVPGKTTIHRSAEHPSSVLLPLHEWPRNRDLPPEPACGEPTGYRCIDGTESLLTADELEADHLEGRTDDGLPGVDGLLDRLGIYSSH